MFCGAENKGDKWREKTQIPRFPPRGQKRSDVNPEISSQISPNWILLYTQPWREAPVAESQKKQTCKARNAPVLAHVISYARKLRDHGSHMDKEFPRLTTGRGSDLSPCILTSGRHCHYSHSTPLSCRAQNSLSCRAPSLPISPQSHLEKWEEGGGWQSESVLTPERSSEGKKVLAEKLH